MFVLIYILVCIWGLTVYTGYWINSKDPVFTPQDHILSGDFHSMRRPGTTSAGDQIERISVIGSVTPPHEAHSGTQAPND